MPNAATSKPFAFLILFALLAGGCQTAKPPEVVFEPVNSSATVNDQASLPQPETNRNADASSLYAEVQSLAGSVTVASSAKEVANALIKVDEIISSGLLSAQDVAKASDIESILVIKLRGKVKEEVRSLQDMALESQSYREGYEQARNAEAVLVIYPLSEDPAVVKEAEELSLRQKEVLRRLEQIRIQRYNHWAAGEIDKSLKALRDKRKGSALSSLKPIEPKLLEPAVDQLYRYCLTEIMDKYDKDEKATVARELSSPSVDRKTLEAF